jgi:hypothetical protein
LEIERGSTRSYCVENWLWKRLQTGRDYRVKEREVSNRNADISVPQIFLYVVYTKEDVNVKFASVRVYVTRGLPKRSGDVYLKKHIFRWRGGGVILHITFDLYSCIHGYSTMKAETANCEAARSSQVPLRAMLCTQ